MILKSITLKDWKHLRHVKLDNLGPGINVIHGPNKSGKSTVAQAIRLALVDLDHGSSAEEARALAPWHGDGIPTAEIGFIVKGENWRLEKRFSKNKGGGAELERNGARVAEGRDVTTKVEKLLDIAKSNEGLGALLWPAQGDAEVPGVDDDLGNALRQRLGVLITDEDNRFMKLLDKALAKWFTPTGKDNREVEKLGVALEQQKRLIGELRIRHERCEQLRAEHESKKLEHLKAQADLEATRREIAALEPRVKALEERKRRLDAIRTKLEDNERQRNVVLAEQADLAAKAAGFASAQEALKQAEFALTPLREKLASCDAALAEASAALTALEPRRLALAESRVKLQALDERIAQNLKDASAAKDALADLERKADEAAKAQAALAEHALALDPRKQLLKRAQESAEAAAEGVRRAESRDVDLRETERRAQALRALAEHERALPLLREAVKTATEAASARRRLGQELAEIGPGDEAGIQALDEMLDQLRQVEAELSAAAIVVTLSSEAGSGVGISADGETREARLSAGESLDQRVLQQAELRLEGWGVVRVKRGEAAASLDEQRARRDELRAAIDELSSRFGLANLRREQWVTELTRRATTREAKEKEEKQLARELKKLAPDGPETLSADLTRLEEQLLSGKRALGLEDAVSASRALELLGDLAQRRDQNDRELQSARAAHKKAQAALEEARANAEVAERKHAAAQGKADAEKALLDNALATTGGKEAILARLAELANVARQQAEERAAFGDIAARQCEFDADLANATSVRQEAQAAQTRAKAAHEKAVEDVAKLTGERQLKQGLLEDSVRRTGGETGLKAKLAALATGRAELEREHEQARLTPEEERLENMLEGERAALAARQTRERDIAGRLDQIEGELRQFDGLHGEQAAAEQRLAQLSATRESDRLDAEAHRLIHDWFLEERDRATDRSLQPVSELVRGWLANLENTNNVPGVRFNGGSLQAEGLKVGEKEVAFEHATSYGEREQLGTLVRLAYAAVLARDEPQTVVLDDPLAHSDHHRHRRMLEVLADAAGRNLQIIVLTCHPERFDQLTALTFDLQQAKAPR